MVYKIRKKKKHGLHLSVGSLAVADKSAVVSKEKYKKIFFFLII